jgi:hypothetical protein
MYTQLEKPKENKGRAVANSVAKQKNNMRQSFGFVDNRPEAVAQRKLQEISNRNLSPYSLSVTNVIQRQTPPPDTEIDWDDLVSWAEEEGCRIQNDRVRGTFLGPDGAGTYPHFHVWRNGNIALSTALNVNDVVGREGVVQIDALSAALERRNPQGAIRSVIQRILSAAS